MDNVLLLETDFLYARLLPVTYCNVPLNINIALLIADNKHYRTLQIKTVF